MKKYLYDYIEKIDNKIKNNKVNNELIEEHLIKIDFFQHERIIHLFVTFFYAIMFLLFSALGLMHILFCPIAIILFIFLLFYVVHYFRLENGVQYLYKQYDQMKEKK